MSRAEIEQGPNLYVYSGSAINLTCVVSSSPTPLDYIFWYHNGKVSSIVLQNHLRTFCDVVFVLAGKRERKAKTVRT